MPNGGKEYDASSLSKQFATRLKNNKELIRQYLEAVGQVCEKIDQAHENLGLASVKSLIMDQTVYQDGDIAAHLQASNNKIIKLNPGDITTLSSSYATMRENINNLRQYMHGENVGKTNVLEIQDWLKAIGGSIKGIKGILLEAELFIGLINADIQGLELFDTLHTGHVNSDIIKAWRDDPKIKQMIKQDQTVLSQLENLINVQGGNPHADITLSVKGQSGAIGYVGVSIKNTSNPFQQDLNKLNKYDFNQTLGLGSKVNLLNQIMTASSYLQILTVADPIFYGQQAFGIHSRTNASKNAGTASYWEDYLDAVALLNVLDRLSGEGGLGNFSSVLIVNGKVFLMSDVLSSIAQHPEMVYGFGPSQWTGRGINSWRSIQEGETMEEAAIRRSDEVKEEMLSVWQSSTLSTKINMAILGALT